MSQLFKLARRDFKVAKYYDDVDGLEFREAGTIPLPRWPDEHWGLDVALFLEDLLARGREHEPRGGTLGTYAAYLAPLIRFCHVKKACLFLELTDSEFSKLVSGLYKDVVLTREGAVPRYDRTTVRQMACVWLDFLSFISSLFGRPDFVGEHGRIRAKRVSKQVPWQLQAASRSRSVATWEHASIGQPDPYNTRLPLRDSHLVRLRNAVYVVANSPFEQRKLLVILELFDALGLRRIEASLLRVSDVEKAIREATKRRPTSIESTDADAFTRPSPFISFRMRKQPDGSKKRERSTPVSPVSLQFFKEYLRQRRLALKAAGWSEEHAFHAFFVNLRTGLPYCPNYFTQQYSRLAKVAGILEPCSPHMCRARFFTRELVRLILAHKLETADDFRRALLNTEVFKEKVREISGHVSTRSLDVYINLAFAEVGDMAKTLTRVEAQRSLDAAALANERYLEAVRRGQDPSTAGAELSRAIAALSLRP